MSGGVEFDCGTAVVDHLSLHLGGEIRAAMDAGLIRVGRNIGFGRLELGVAAQVNMHWLVDSRLVGQDRKRDN
jgi:hypothetical protein